MIAKQIFAERLESFLAKAKERGVRVTPQRLAIHRIVASSEDHPGAEEVHKKLRRRFPTVSLDTVYRTLRLLEKLELVSAVHPHHDTQRFDANTRPHHHFICLRCGLIRDFTNPRLSALSIPSESLAFGLPRDLSVEVRGVCNNCLNKPGKNRKNQ